MTATILIDVDGTLVDSTYLHVMTWCQALAEAGHARPGSAIQRQIGKDGALMMESLLGATLAKEIGAVVSERRSELYLSMKDQLRPLPGARDLVAELVDRGANVVLATSASPSERELLLEVLDLSVTVAAVTDADDVTTAKPEPDLLHVAMERVDADRSRTVMVGDATWDVESAKNAGIPCIGLETGGLSSAELYDAGAVAVYATAQHLLDCLDDSPIGELLRPRLIAPCNRSASRREPSARDATVAPFLGGLR